MSKEPTIKILQEPEPNRINSFWFDGETILLTLGNRNVSVQAIGDIRVKLTKKKDEYWEKGDRARDRAIDLNYTDKHLNKLNNWDGWGNNNWFELYLTCTPTKADWKKHLADVEFWKGRVRDYVKYRKSYEEYKKDFSVDEWLDGVICDDFEEALDNAKEVIKDDDYWIRK